MIDDLAQQAEALRHALAHRAYHAGVDDVIRRLASEDADHPYLLYKTVGDKKTRPSHAAMSGKVAHRDSPLADEFRALLEDYNCRCTLVPLTADQALRRGIDDNTGATADDDPDALYSADLHGPPIPPVEEVELPAEQKERVQKIWIREEREKARIAAKGKNATVDEKLAVYRTPERLAEEMARVPPVPQTLRDAPRLISEDKIEPLRRDKMLLESKLTSGDLSMLERIKLHGSLAIVKLKTAAGERQRANALARLKQEEQRRKNTVHAVLAMPPKLRSPIAGHIGKDFPPVQREAIASGKAWLSRTLAKRTWTRTNGETLEVDVMPALRAESHSSYAPGIASIRKGGDEIDVVHELAHSLEEENEILEASQRFLEKRTRGENPVKLKDYFPNSNYGDEVKSLGQDRWQSLLKEFGYNDSEAERLAYYVGRNYGGKNTEIITMGIELMRKDPELFAKKDLEYFKFILAAMRGAL